MRMISDAALIRELKSIAGSGHVMAGGSAAHHFVRGHRYGEGTAVAVVRPGSLVDMWRVARATVRAGRIILMQAANTGLTGGSTPDGMYDRGVVVINTMRLKGIHMLNAGAQVICLPGTTLGELDSELRPLQREPHSEAGPSSLGTTVLGGICNNSGGTLVRRGPAFTEAGIYARVDETGELRLVNELGIDLGRDPEEQLKNLETGNFDRVLSDMHERACSGHGYLAQVADVDANSPARYNANPRYLKGASGSAGRVIVFGVRLDTFPRPLGTHVFHIATDDPGLLSGIRRGMLKEAALVPVAAEYIHRDMFRTAARFGRDVIVAAGLFGPERLSWLARFKTALDNFAGQFGLADMQLGHRLLQGLSRFAPVHLPETYRQRGLRYAHHLFLKVEAGQLAAVRAFLAEAVAPSKGVCHECSPAEGEKVFLHRFAAADASIRYAALKGRQISGLVGLDVALRRNDKAWWYVVPDHLKHMVERTLVYGHFFCHVFHQDFILKKGVDVAAFRRGMLAHYGARGGECPAEQNVGHLYPAKPALVEHYRKLDPTNTLNPGIGKTSRFRNWQ